MIANLIGSLVYNLADKLLQEKAVEQAKHEIVDTPVRPKDGKTDPPAIHVYEPCGCWTRAPDGGGGYTYTFREADNMGEVVDDAYLLRVGS